MANLVAFSAFNISGANFNDINDGAQELNQDAMSWTELASELRSIGLSGWTNGTHPAINSFGEVIWDDGGAWYSFLMVGSNLSLNEATGSARGTINYIAEYTTDDPGPGTVAEVPTFVIGGLSLNASDMAHAMLTADTADDRALLASMFSANDLMTMSNQADQVRGFAGNDTILGQGGNDTLMGDAGNDLLTGGLGKDLLSGNSGADRFIFTATNQTGNTGATADRITDFTHGTDRIDLSAIDASTIGSGNNSFSFAGTAAFGTGSGGQIRFAQTDAAGTANDFTLVYLDTDSDTAAEAVIRLDGLVTLTASDFVL